MENWNNLNKLLILDRKDNAQKELESQKLIELCNSGTEELKEIKYLFKNGAAVNCYADLSTPLISAIRTDNLKLGNYLLKIHASISYHPKELTDNAFWEALKTKKYEFLKIFIEKRCKLERITVEIENEPRIITPLIYATRESDVLAVQYLLRHYNINVNDKDGVGNTALHYNVSKNPQTEDDTEIGKMLIAAGADTQIVNLSSQTPEDMALDTTAKSMLLYAKLDRDIPEKEPEVAPESTPDGPRKTSKNKLKI